MREVFRQRNFSEIHHKKTAPRSNNPNTGGRGDK